MVLNEGTENPAAQAADFLPIDAALIEKLREYTASAVNPKRYEHSVRTAETAERLCRRYGLDAQIGYFAGIVHDMCKDMDNEEIFSLAVLDGEPVSVLETQKKFLLHGRAAAVKLQKDFDIHNGDILEAVRVHTFGCAGMGDLAKVIYIADKIEPGRAHSGESYIQECIKLDLDKLLLKIAMENINYLKKQKKAIAPATADLIQSLQTDFLSEKK